MIDMDHHDLPAYAPPAIVRVGAVIDIAADLAKLGVDGTKLAYVPGDPVDWSNGRVS
jgi:hypothetical protein